MRVASDNLKTAEFMNNTDGTRRLFTFMETTESEKLRFEILCILVRLAETESGRKVLRGPFRAGGSELSLKAFNGRIDLGFFVQK